VRIALIDPPAFTLPYDHQLASALARLGLDVELFTSHFRFGEAPSPDGYRRREPFYPLSTRLFSRSRLRLPLKAAEHAAGLATLRVAARCDVRHVQWAPLPQLDVRFLPAGAAAAITAHDVLPRRTRDRVDLWKRMYARFGGVVVHSAHGRERLVAELGVDPRRIALIPHPVFPGRVRYEDDGATLVLFGLLQRYKQVEHAVEVARRLGVRLVVAGDPLYDISGLMAAPGVEWRIGYQRDGEIDDLLARSTVALFPYRAELDQSGALLRALGSGAAVAAYDVGGIVEPVQRFGAGIVAPADDVDALTAGVAGLLASREALEAARAGARRATEELTWDAAARDHLSLYERLLGR
jgi:glycosyltransferase involved in cell wall biosynthesis